jgi:hypothetical protein
VLHVLDARRHGEHLANPFAKPPAGAIVKPKRIFRERFGEL